jgi:transmembrane sensor
MDNEQEGNLRYLFSRYANGLSTREEYDRFLNLLAMADRDTELRRLLDELWLEMENLEVPVIGTERSVPLYRRYYLYAAAAVILLIGFSILFFRSNPAVTSNDVAPYTAMAILKSGGKTILLDSTANGKIAQTNVTKSPGEQLTYVAVSEKNTAVYDTIQIPAGGRPYTVKLSDGRKITLNAASILRYPETFSKNRKEEIELISGEIYANIIHNTAAPLQIISPGQMTTDIGTEFNLKAYADEVDSRTTLIEGALKVSANAKEKTLSPGYQAIKTADNLTSEKANIMQVTAWKDGLFRFNGDHIDAVMRELARWYHIDVRYEGKKTDEVFYARVSRKRNISEVLRILERSQKVSFKVEGRRITVLSRS